MLRGIPTVLSPDLLKTMAEMGHGDKLVLGDTYFASASMAKDSRLIRADGISSTELLDAILQFMPLDTWVDSCVTVIAKQEEDGSFSPAEMTERYQEIVRKYEPAAADTFRLGDRFAFYEEARTAFAVVATGETRPYGCIIIQKGVF